MTVTDKRALRGYDFFRHVLGSPRHVLAPMVEHSDLPYRVLARRWGADACFSPMLHSRMVVENKGYVREHLEPGTGDPSVDRPLVVQLCGHDADTMLCAARKLQDRCDAIDINLGCPQIIAKRGYYGSFLMDDVDLVERIVRTLAEGLEVPVTCKIRIFPDVQHTVQYAQRLERAGCSMLTVHGRLREQKGPLTGLADWSQIRAVKQSVGIPVVANGNVVVHGDVERCLQATGCDAVMSAEGHLYNPAIFRGAAIPTIRECLGAYLSACQEFPLVTEVPLKGHIFKICRCALDNTSYRREEMTGEESGLLQQLSDFRTRLGTCGDLAQCMQLGEELLAMIPADWQCLPYYRHTKSISVATARDDNLQVDSKCCQ